MANCFTPPRPDSWNSESPRISSLEIDMQWDELKQRNQEKQTWMMKHIESLQGIRRWHFLVLLCLSAAVCALTIAYTRMKPQQDTSVLHAKISKLQESLKEKEKQLEEKNHQLDVEMQRNMSFSELQELLKEKEKLVENTNNQLFICKNELLEEKDKRLEDKNQQIEERNRQLEEEQQRSARIYELQELLKGKEELVENTNHQLFICKNELPKEKDKRLENKKHMREPIKKVDRFQHQRSNSRSCSGSTTASTDGSLQSVSQQSTPWRGFDEPPANLDPTTLPEEYGFDCDASASSCGPRTVRSRASSDCSFSSDDNEMLHPDPSNYMDQLSTILENASIDLDESMTNPHSIISLEDFVLLGMQSTSLPTLSNFDSGDYPNIGRSNSWHP